MDAIDSPDVSIAATERASSPPSEAKDYYAGLPTRPVLVARTGTRPWVMSKGAPVEKEVYPVFNHKISDAWESGLSSKVITELDEMGVKWTSIDLVKIFEVEDSFRPVILWIGVLPKSLPSEEGKTVAFRCLDTLHEFNITDVDVEIRESVATRRVLYLRALNVSIRQYPCVLQLIFISP